MTNAAVFIEQYLSSVGNADEKVYRDEPIVMTAREAHDALPEKYREMKRIGSADPSLLANEAKLFVNQAKFMEDYDDSYRYGGVFMCYYPTYRRMNDRQLRGYFTWRAAVRRGEVEEASLSFAYVYLYELINLVGVASPGDAAGKIASFANDYAKFDRSILRLALRWRRDLAICHGLSDVLENDASDRLHAAAVRLSSPHASSEDELYGALASLSSVNPENSKLIKEHPEARALFAKCYTAFFDFCEAKRKISLPERLFGKVARRTYIMFPSAIYYDAHRGEERTFTSPGEQTFVCKGGAWSVIGYPEMKNRSAALGTFVKSLDALLRPYFGMKKTSCEATGVLRETVAATAAEFFEEAKRREAAKIEFNFSALPEIRRAADETAMKLIVDEEEDEEVITVDSPTAPSLLDENEKKILRLILDGTDAESAARELGIPLSVAVDSINEKLFDVLLDCAIEFTDSGVAAIEDYADELKGFLI